MLEILASDSHRVVAAIFPPASETENPDASAHRVLSGVPVQAIHENSFPGTACLATQSDSENSQISPQILLDYAPLSENRPEYPPGHCSDTEATDRRLEVS